jgi:hypothetical protein
MAIPATEPETAKPLGIASTVSAVKASVVVVAACSVLIASCTSTAPTLTQPAACNSTAPGTATEPAMISYLTAHRQDWAADIDDGRGRSVLHNADAPIPTASAMKLIDLAAYARAAATGTLDRNAPIPITDWQKWYLPLDGGSHIKALAYLHIPAADGVPAPGGPTTVTAGQLADVMIRFSDSASQDALRVIVGNAAVRAVMAEYDIAGDPPSSYALYMSIIDAHAATFQQQADVSERSFAMTARQFHTLMAALAIGTFGPGSDIARTVLEYQPPAKGLLGLGFKGGSLPGIITEVFEARRADGSTAIGTLLIHRLPSADYQTDLHTFSDQKVLMHAMLLPTGMQALVCAASTPSSAIASPTR